MNFRKLLEGKTVDEMMAIADNWYSRLNKLKEVHAEAVEIEDIVYARYTNDKATNIAKELMNRLSEIAHLYSRAILPLPRYDKGTHVSGGYPMNDNKYTGVDIVKIISNEALGRKNV